MNLKELAARQDFGSIVERAAEAAHEANRLYCSSLGDESQPVWADAPDWQKASARAGVMAVITNPEIGPAQLHEKWCEQKLADGWVYGETKDPEKKTHPCLVSYGALGPDQQFKDQLFHETVITSVMASLRPKRGELQSAAADPEPVASSAPVEAAEGAADPVSMRVALIKKGNDSIAVQLRDSAHLAQLCAHHGESNVEVQS